MIVLGYIGVITGFGLGLFIPGFFLVSTYLYYDLSRLEKYVFSVAISFGILHVIMITMSIFRVELIFYNILAVESTVTLILFFSMVQEDEKGSFDSANFFQEFVRDFKAVL